MRQFIKIVAPVLIALAMCMGCSSDNGSSNNSNGPEGQDGKGGSLATFVLKGDYLYVVDHQNLNVFSVVNASNPTKVGGTYVGFSIETLFSFGAYLFVGSMEALYIYDITVPESPKLLSMAQHFRACDPVVANATHAYVTLHSNGFCGNTRNVLLIYDIANPAKPVQIASKQLVMPRGLALYGDYLVVCDDELKIFDITNPEDTRFLKSVPHTFKDVVIYNETLFAFGENRVSQYKWSGSNFTDLELVSTLVY